MADGTAVIVSLLGFTLLWTVYLSIANAGMSLHGDVAEAYVWGREFRLGYHQHPPFWAWVAGLWFLIFPSKVWAFNLLAVLNSAIGLAGSWRLIGLFSRGAERFAAFALLLLTPFYTFMCYKYNANTIFLSVWPWTLYFLLTSIETRSRVQAVWFGVLLAVGLLSKYYAITLDLTCLAASLVHPRGRDYWSSACPYISLAVCVVLVIPHIIWLVHDDAPPVMYVWRHTGIGLGMATDYAARFLVAVILYHIVVLLLVLSGTYPRRGIALGPRSLVRDRVLVVLVIAPVVLTMLFGLFFELKISSNMTVGVFPLLPLLAIRTVPQLSSRVLFRRVRLLACVIAAAAVLASPAIAYVSFAWSPDPEATEPRPELGRFVTRLWHGDTGMRLRYVAGSDPYENAVAFYSPDHPVVFLSFNHHIAPWVRLRALRASGMVAVCVQGDRACESAAAPFLTPDTKTVSVTLRHRFWGHDRAPVSFNIHLVPPQVLKPQRNAALR